MTADLPPGAETDLPTRGQESIWRMERDCPGTPAYNVPVALRLTGPLDLRALDHALRLVVQRHDALRTRIVPGRNGEARAEYDGRTPFVTRVLADRADDCSHLAAQEARTPFDSASPLPVRATVLRLGDADHVLLLTMHHTAADGWSLGIIAKELSALYPAGSSLPEPGTYRGYAGRQRETQPAGDRSLRYWAGKLAGAGRTELPADRPRPGRRDLRGGTTFFELPRALSTELERLSKQAGASLLMTLGAAVTMLVGVLTGDDDVTIGTRLANRPREFQEVVGLFANHVALRTSLGGDPEGHEALTRVRQTAFEAYRHQQAPFERVLDELGVGRDAGRPPLFQVMVQHLKFGHAPLELPGIVVSPLGHPAGAFSSDLLSACIRTGSTGSSRYDLSFDFVEGHEGVWARVDFSTQLFDPTTIARFIAQLVTILETMAADPSIRLSELRRKAER